MYSVLFTINHVCTLLPMLSDSPSHVVTFITVLFAHFFQLSRHADFVNMMLKSILSNVPLLSMHIYKYQATGFYVSKIAEFTLIVSVIFMLHAVLEFFEIII